MVSQLTQESLIILIGVVVIGFYVLTLIFVLRNGYNFIIKQGRIKAANTHLVSFYINAIMVLILRLIQYSIEMTKDDKKESNLEFSLGTIAVLFSFNMGGSMVLMMMNLHTNLFSIFNGEQIKFSSTKTIILLLIFFCIDIPYIVFVVLNYSLGGKKYVEITLEYSTGTFTLLFCALSYSTYEVIK